MRWAGKRFDTWQLKDSISVQQVWGMQWHGHGMKAWGCRVQLIPDIGNADKGHADKHLNFSVLYNFSYSFASYG